MISSVYRAAVFLLLAILALLAARFWFRGIFKDRLSDLCLGGILLLALGYLLENLGQYLLLAMGLATLIVAVIRRTSMPRQRMARSFTLGVILLILALLRGLIF